jgi:hypothetical protein
MIAFTVSVPGTCSTLPLPPTPPTPAASRTLPLPLPVPPPTTLAPLPLPLPLPPPLGKEAALVVVAGLDTGVALDRHKSLGDIDLLDPAKLTNKLLVSQIQYASNLVRYCNFTNYLNN